MKKPHAFITSICLLGGLSLSAQAISITIGSGGVGGVTTGVTAQGWIRSDIPTNDPGNNFIFVGSLAGGSELRGFTGFDVSAIPDSAVINSVSVTFYQSTTLTGSTGDSIGDSPLNLVTPTGTFSNTDTWNGSNGFYGGAILGAISTDPTLVIAQDPFEFTTNAALVSHVQSALASDDVQFGLIAPDLEATTERLFYSFGPNDGGTVDIAPSITIDYTVVPEPSSTTLLGLGGLALILRRKR